MLTAPACTWHPGGLRTQQGSSCLHTRSAASFTNTKMQGKAPPALSTQLLNFPFKKHRRLWSRRAKIDTLYSTKTQNLLLKRHHWKMEKTSSKLQENTVKPYFEKKTHILTQTLTNQQYEDNPVLKNGLVIWRASYKRKYIIVNTHTKMLRSLSLEGRKLKSQEITFHTH